MPSKFGHDWRPRLALWKREGDRWRCDRAELEAAILAAQVDDEHVRRRMGNGYHLLAAALEGKALSRYEVNMVEWGITPTARGSISMWAPR